MSHNSFPVKSSTLNVPHVLTKTHSASNVFSRTISSGNVTSPLRNSLESPFTTVARNGDNSDNNNKGPKSSASFLSYGVKCAGGESEGGVRNSNPVSFDRFMMRRGSSVENLNSSSGDVNANGGLKKIKFENDVSWKFLICGAWFICMILIS